MCDTTNNTNEQNDKSLENLRDLYKRYCECRDQELDRFWKNSTFVWIFLAICFGAFGQVILKYFDLKTADSNNIFDLKKTYEVLLSFISFIGLLCSFIWVWMARGMKAWFEVFEMAIWQMDRDNVFKLPNENTYNIENFWRIKDSRFVWQKAFFGAESNSPSKIVILIGRLLCLVWFFAFLWALMSIFNILPFENSLECGGLIFLFLFIAVVVIYFCHFFIQGSVLLSDGEAEVKNHIKTQMDAIIKDKNKDVQLDCSIQMSIIRFFWCRRFNVSLKNKGKIDIANDFNSLKEKVKSKYFEITKIKKVNDNMIKVCCKAKHNWKDLFNIDRYNLHIEDANEQKSNIKKSDNGN
ncbi:MAG: hypothetical protein IKO56_00155 [Alphaproteobacteria bacterium]|nr:hypothetical protein [Alphaproteobacteria bacterium]